MNQFLPRNEPMASVVSATERGSAVRAVTPVPQTASRTDAAYGEARPQPNASAVPEDNAQPVDEQARAHAAYAKVQTKIASVIADLGSQASGPNAGALEQAENNLVALLPQPSVVLPLPPADQKMVEFVAQVAQSIARQVAQTRAAHAGATPITVDAATGVELGA